RTELAVNPELPLRVQNDSGTEAVDPSQSRSATGLEELGRAEPPDRCLRHESSRALVASPRRRRYGESTTTESLNPGIFEKRTELRKRGLTLARKSQCVMVCLQHESCLGGRTTWLLRLRARRPWWGAMQSSRFSTISWGRRARRSTRLCSQVDPGSER